jgi:hypothetical protein
MATAQPAGAQVAETGQTIDAPPPGPLSAATMEPGEDALAVLRRIRAAQDGDNDQLATACRQEIADGAAAPPPDQADLGFQVRVKPAAARAAVLAQIEDLAGLQFDAQDISIVAEVPAESMMGGAADATRAYDRGRLAAEARVRGMLLKMAAGGSAPAQKMILDIASANKRATAADHGAGPAAAELAAVRGHLAPLILCPPDAPASELARMAALKIIQLQGARA